MTSKPAARQRGSSDSPNRGLQLLAEIHQKMDGVSEEEVLALLNAETKKSAKKPRSTRGRKSGEDTRRRFKRASTRTS